MSPSPPRQGPSSDNLTAFTLPDLPEMTLPPLPAINDAKLYDIVVSHSSLFQCPKKTMNLFPETPIIDYEKLEHVGDAILGAMITVLLHDLFPLLGEGPATTLKGCLVSNATLARISKQYGIPQRLRASQASLRVTRAQTKTQASMFEAWIAGVFYSVLSCGEADIADHTGANAGDETGYTADGEDDAEEIAEVTRQLDDVSQENVGIKVEEVRKNRPGPGNSITPDKLARVESRSSPRRNLAEELSLEPRTVPSETAATSPDPPIMMDGLGGCQKPSCDVEEESSDVEMSSDFCPTTERSLSNARPHISQGHAGSASQLPAIMGSNLKYRWLAMTLLDEWLRPLFTPIAHYALDQLRKEQIRLDALPRGPSRKMVLDDDTAKENDQAMGAVGLLELYVGKSRATRIVKYSFEQVDGDWHATCSYTENGEALTAQAVRTNQRTAKALAAHRVCEALGLERKS